MGRLVEFQNVKKTYHMGEVEIHAVDGVDFEINEGELWSLSDQVVPEKQPY